MNIKEISDKIKLNNEDLNRELKLRKSLSLTTKPICCIQCRKKCRSQQHCITKVRSDILLISFLPDDYETYNLICKILGKTNIDYRFIDYTTIIKNNTDVRVTDDNITCVISNLLFELTTYKPKKVLGLGKEVSSVITQALDCKVEVIKGITSTLSYGDYNFIYKEITGVNELISNFDNVKNIFVNELVGEIRTCF